MKRIICMICTGALAFGMLAGCGKKAASSETPAETGSTQEIIPQATAAPVSTPKISARYNSLDEGDKDEVSQVRAELSSVAQSCMDIYETADRGSAINAVLSADTVRAMVDRIGQQGFAAIDFDGRLDMRCPESIEYFGSCIDSGNDISVSYYMVYNDGQISVYHLGRQNGLWYLIAMSSGWDKNCKPEFLTEGRYVIGDVRYTEKGWLIYSRDTDSFDANQRSNTNSYVFIRVKPCAADKKALCDKYIKPIGYFENNLFTTTWTQADFTPIDFNSLFSMLFGMYNGTQSLTASNVEGYYPSVGGTRLSLVPTESFERTVQHYFNIDSSVLKAISDYSFERGGYYFLGYADGMYNVTPRFPEPEVTDYWYNSDGSVTMRVDAVFKWYGTDRAFSHDVTVMETSDGFRYVSNTLYADENSILPERKLSMLLDIELEKLDS